MEQNELSQQRDREINFLSYVCSAHPLPVRKKYHNSCLLISSHSSKLFIQFHPSRYCATYRDKLGTGNSINQTKNIAVYQLADHALTMPWHTSYMYANRSETSKIQTTFKPNWSELKYTELTPKGKTTKTDLNLRTCEQKQKRNNKKHTK